MREVLGFPLNWPMWVAIGLCAIYTVVGVVYGEWSHLLFCLSGICVGRALWEHINRDFDVRERFREHLKRRDEGKKQ